MKPSPDQKETAMLHATAWGHAWDDLREYSGSNVITGKSPEFQTMIEALATLAMTVSGGYRRIANGSNIEE